MGFNNFLRNWGADVQTGCGEIRPLAFPYPVFGRFAYTPYALNGHFFWFLRLRLWEIFVMSAHIIRRVREQPDTGYRKNQRADFAAARLNWFWVWMKVFCLENWGGGRNYNRGVEDG